jgi:hypothetical protein
MAVMAVVISLFSFFLFFFRKKETPLFLLLTFNSSDWAWDEVGAATE